MLMAAAEGNVATIKALLDKGEVTVDQTDYDKRSAAHLAASEGRLEVLKLLAVRVCLSVSPCFAWEVEFNT